MNGLIVVDVQRDFCEGGSLAVDGGAAVAAEISSMIRASGDRYGMVVASRDWHVDPGPHFALVGEEPDYREIWPVHCVAGSAGAAWQPGLVLPAGAVVVSKGEHEAAYSGFEGRDERGVALADVLTAAGVDTIDVVGIATSYCVRATALDGARLGFRTRVLAGLTVDVDPAATPATLAELEAAGVEVVPAGPAGAAGSAGSRPAGAGPAGAAGARPAGAGAGPAAGRPQWTSRASQARPGGRPSGEEAGPGGD